MSAPPDAMARLTPPRRFETIPLPRASLKRWGWRRAAAGPLEPRSFAALLSELRRSARAHSWRWLSRGRQLDGLLRAEARLRPGVVFAYYGLRRDGAMELFGAAALAERVTAWFPHEGFPVAARGYVLRRFRGNGLYKAMLAHRVRVCRRVWGRRLNAIHLGSSNPRVWRTLRSAPGGARFSALGVERLPDGRRRLLVRDFVHLAPSFARALRAQSRRRPALRERLERLLGRGFGPRDYAGLLQAWHDSGRPAGAFSRLLALCESIPLEKRPSRV